MINKTYCSDRSFLIKLQAVTTYENNCKQIINKHMLNQTKARQVWVPALLYPLLYLDCHEPKVI